MAKSRLLNPKLFPSPEFGNSEHRTEQRGTEHVAQSLPGQARLTASPFHSTQQSRGTRTQGAVVAEQSEFYSAYPGQGRNKNQTQIKTEPQKVELAQKKKHSKA